MMKNHKIWVIVVLVLTSVLLTAAAPMAQDVVPLTIENNTNDYVTLRLDGPQYYYLYIQPGETRVYTIQRGVYESTFYQCGVFTEDSMDLTKKLTIIVPACGTKAFYGPEQANVIDAAKMIKLVRVYFENKTNHNLVVILTGPTTHVFFIWEGDTLEFTIPKGMYTAEQYGCPSYKTWQYQAVVNKYYELACPQW